MKGFQQLSSFDSIPITSYLGNKQFRNESQPSWEGKQYKVLAGGTVVGVAGLAPPLLCGCPLTQKEKEKALPRALAVSMTGHLNGSSPFILPSDHTVKPLLMSSAKMMLVRRAGWDRRAWTTAFWEHCCWSSPNGSMLATSGRVDDLW